MRATTPVVLFGLLLAVAYGCVLEVPETGMQYIVTSRYITGGVHETEEFRVNLCVTTPCSPQIDCAFCYNNTYAPNEWRNECIGRRNNITVSRDSTYPRGTGLQPQFFVTFDMASSTGRPSHAVLNVVCTGSYTNLRQSLVTHTSTEDIYILDLTLSHQDCLQVAPPECPSPPSSPCPPPSPCPPDSFVFGIVVGIIAGLLVSISFF